MVNLNALLRDSIGYGQDPAHGSNTEGRVDDRGRAYEDGESLPGEMNDFTELADISRAVFNPDNIGMLGEFSHEGWLHIDSRELRNSVERDSHLRRFCNGA